MILAVLLLIAAILLFGAGPVTGFLSWIAAFILVSFSVGMISAATGLSPTAVFVLVPVCGAALFGAVIGVAILYEGRKRK